MDDLKNIEIEIENLRRLNKQSYAERANLYQAEANKSEAGLRNLFFTMAMSVITISSPLFFGRASDAPIMSEIIKTIITISLIMLFISIILGLIDFVITIKFFEKWATNKSEGERIWSQYALPSYEDFVKMGNDAKHNALDSEHTPILALALQATFVLLGFSLLLVAGLITLWQ